MIRLITVLFVVVVSLSLAACSESRFPQAGAAPRVELAVEPRSVPVGTSANVTWNATGATSCVAGGAWSGQFGPSGRAASPPLRLQTSVLSLRCSGSGGIGSAAAVVNVVQGESAGLDFPGVAAAGGTVRFRFNRPLAIYPATYIWRVKLRSQPNYYTAFFWGNDGPFQWDQVGFLRWKRPASNTYYGAHPYPFPAPNLVPRDEVGPRYWEIAVNGLDILGDSQVEYERWHTQALRVWGNSSGKHHEFYWDLPDQSRVIRRVEPSSYGEVLPPAPALTWGDAPWAPGKEVMYGVMRGIQIYQAALPMKDLLAEISAPLSTDIGRGSVWYVNLDPTPIDISDHSGAANDPEWVGPKRPKLWESTAR